MLRYLIALATFALFAADASACGPLERMADRVGERIERRAESRHSTTYSSNTVTMTTTRRTVRTTAVPMPSPKLYLLAPGAPGCPNGCPLHPKK